MMRILIGTQPEQAHTWLEVVQAALPDAVVRLWQEGDQALADYLLVWKAPPEFWSGRGTPKAVFVLGAGVDALLDQAELLPAGVPLYRLEDAGMGLQMAEYVVHAVLRYFRRFDVYAAQQAQTRWHALVPPPRSSFTLAVLGAGVLGRAILDACAPWGFPLMAWSRSAKSIPGVQCFHGANGLKDCLQQARVLINVLPLTEATRGLIDAERLSWLPQGSYLINVARGAHLVPHAVVAALHSGQLAGATLDAFAEEPLPADHPYWHAPHLDLTPHIAAQTLPAEAARQIAHRIAALERGEVASGIIERQRGY